jgi:8-hydroxy-5-deazaflavin:NADPH oxidoreductase
MTTAITGVDNRDALQGADAVVLALIRTAGFEPVKIGGIEQSGRLEVGGDLHDLVVSPAEARSLIGAA